MKDQPDLGHDLGHTNRIWQLLPAGAIDKRRTSGNGSPQRGIMGSFFYSYWSLTGLQIIDIINKFHKLTLKWWGHFYHNIISVCNVFSVNVMFLYKTSRLLYIMSQYCSYWWPGAIAPSHQQPQCWLCTRAFPAVYGLTHWGRVIHICTSELTIIGSDNGLLPDWCQAIIWTNAGKLLFGPPGTNFSEMLIEIHTFSFEKMHVKMLSVKRRPFCLSLNVLIVM